jgi:hypothetical protein
MVRMSRSILITAMAALALLRPAASPAGSGCKASCQAAFDDELINTCGACAADPINTRDDCRDTVDENFPNCVDDCPAFDGRCTITKECVDACRSARDAQDATCTRVFQHRIRTECVGGRKCLDMAKKNRSRCQKKCRHGSSTAISVPETSPMPANPCDCQGICIRRIVGSCYDECDDRCEGDTTALGICQRGCRNAQCTRLENTCTMGDSGAAHAYVVCCTGCANCQDSVDCEVTTTSTSTTRTTTTETVSTTTVATSTTSTTM